MPRLKRRPKNRLAGCGRWHLYELETGVAWPYLGADEAFHGDENAMRDAWERLRLPFLRKWVAEHPGTRPWAWWRFDAPERRRCLSGVHPFDDPARWALTEGLSPAMQRRAYELWFGVPVLYGSTDFDCVFESEFDCLNRLGLLTPEERAAVRAGVQQRRGRR